MVVFANYVGQSTTDPDPKNKEELGLNYILEASN